MSNTNFFTIKAVLNKPGEIKYTPNNVPYVGVSVGVPKFNKQTQQTEYSNFYVKAWRDLAQVFAAPDAKGMYRITGELNSFQDTGGNGQSNMITELVAQSVEKLAFIPRNNNYNQQPQYNTTMPPGQPATVNGPGAPQRRQGVPIPAPSGNVMGQGQSYPQNNQQPQPQPQGNQQQLPQQQQQNAWPSGNGDLPF